jgi:hypothetical protein
MVSKSRRGVIKHRKPNKSTRKVQIRKPLRIKRKAVSQSKSKGKGKGNGKGNDKGKGKGKGKGKSKGKGKKSKRRSQSKKRKVRGGSPLDAKEDDLSSSEDQASSSDEDTDDEESSLVDRPGPVRTRRIPARLFEFPEVPNDGRPVFPFPPRMDIPAELDPMGQPLEAAPAATEFVQRRSPLEDRLAAAGRLEPPPHDPVLPLPMVPGTPMPEEDPSFEINRRLANLHIDDAQQPGPSFEEINRRLANLRIDGDRDE